MLQDVSGLARGFADCSAQQKVDAIRWMLAHDYPSAVFKPMVVLVVCPDEFRRGM